MLLLLATFTSAVGNTLPLLCVFCHLSWFLDGITFQYSSSILYSSRHNPPRWLFPFVGFVLWAVLLPYLSYHRHSPFSDHPYPRARRHLRRSFGRSRFLYWHRCLEPSTHYRLTITYFFGAMSDLFFLCKFSASDIWQVPFCFILKEFRGIISTDNLRQPSAFSSKRQVVAKENGVFHKFSLKFLGRYISSPCQL